MKKNYLILLILLLIILAILLFKIYATDSSDSKHNSNKKNYIQYNEKFMNRAIELSKEASIIKKTGGVFGAVVVKDNEIVGEGYNQVVKQNDPTWHAEIQALREAGKRLKTPHLTGCVLYTSAECCPMCLAAAYWAHVSHIYYGATMQDALKYGNFDDADFTKEICLNPKDRSIKSTQKMHKEAVQVWKEFSQMPDRAKY